MGAATGLKAPGGNVSHHCPDFILPLGLFLIVVGTIYAGIATPTEAASFGVVASIGLAAWNGTLSLEMLKSRWRATCAPRRW